MNFKSIAQTNLLFGSLIISLGLQALPAAAQPVTDAQVSALVEALRHAAPPQTANDGMYSQWQVLPNNISRWAQFCTKQALTPQQFEADATKAKSIVTCIVGDLLRDEYKASSNNELTAVRRAACWWMTGESAACKSGTTATYADKVISVYQQQPKK
ncbi:hypothetical protein [Microcoleus sp. OTE_8_concoct_300]|uniref:hypothetical protein n=1 Tax=Microcoleus sp. OTE_8_concoct_300 TaxID=2964710 RepID=UPI00403FA332